VRIPFGFMKSPGGGGGAFDPATLALTGWWRASYAGSPWTPTASAGTSGANGNLTEATNPPATAVNAINSLDTADFDGTNDKLTGPNASALFDAASWSAWVLFNADTAPADQGAAFRYTNPTFFAEGGSAYLSMGFSSGGIHVAQYQVGVGTHKERVLACGTAAWHLAQARYDGVDLELRLDSGAWSSIASANLELSGSTAVVLGNPGFASAPYDGDIAELAMSDVTLSDGDFDNVVSYVNSRYALAL
jgi:hypothetical protein